MASHTTQQLVSKMLFHKIILFLGIMVELVKMMVKTII